MFFKRIFKKPPPPEPVVVKLDLVALGERINNLKNEKFETIKPTFNDIIGEIIGTRETLLSNLKKLADANPSEEVYPKLLKSSIEARKLLVEKISRALANIERPSELSKNTLDTFDGKLAKSINLTTDAVVTHGRYVRTTFEPEFAVLQSNLRRLHDLTKHVHEKIGATINEINRLESLSSETNSLTELILSIKKNQDDIESLEMLLKKTEENMREEEARLKQLMSSEEFKRAADTKREHEQIESEIARLEGEVKSAFSDISRPLRKLEKLLSSGGYHMDREKVKALELCINEPQEIVSSDEKISAAEGLLQEAAELLDEGKIELDDRERRKKLERIRKLATRLREFKRRLDVLNHRLNAVQRDLQYPVQTQISELKQSIAEQKSKIDHAQKSIEDLKKKHEQAEKEIEDKRADIEKHAGEILGAKIELTF